VAVAALVANRGKTAVQAAAVRTLALAVLVLPVLATTVGAARPADSMAVVVVVALVLLARLGQRALAAMVALA
jgi:hypothetical protein